MATKIFVNLPVKNLEKSMDFFSHLGFTFNPQFTDEKAACMVVSENIFAMLLIEDYFKTYTQKPVSDATQQTEVLIALDCNSKEEVESTVAKAVQKGAVIYADPQDHGWMYVHSFADPDGHQWEFMYMDASQLPAQ